MRRLAALLTLAACRGSTVPTECRVRALDNDRFLFEGEPTRLSVGVVVSCNRAEALPASTAMTVKVLDPSGAVRPGAAAGPLAVTELSARTFTAEVPLTPDRPGPWRVSVLFDEELGRVENAFEVIARRPDAGVEVRATHFPGPCQQYALTARGTLLCASRRPSASPELITERGQKLFGAQFLVDGDVVWRLNEQSWTLDRWVDTRAGNLQRTHVGLAGFEGRLAGGADDVWLASIAEEPWPGNQPRILHAATLPDGGLATTTQSLAPLIAVGLIGTPEHALVVGYEGKAVRATTFAADAGAPVSRDLAASGFVEIVGSTRDELWAYQSGRLNAVALGASIAVPRVGFDRIEPLLLPQAPVVPTDFDPRLGPIHHVFPATPGGRLQFEHFDPGPGFDEAVSATPDHAFAPSADGTQVKIFRRAD